MRAQSKFLSGFTAGMLLGGTIAFISLLWFVERGIVPFDHAAAAVFEGDVRASSTNSYRIGALPQEWTSINDVIFFNEQHMGIGSASFSPVARLHVKDGDIYVDTAGKGVIGRSPDGSCWRGFTISGGNPIVSAVACP